MTDIAFFLLVTQNLVTNILIIGLVFFFVLSVQKLKYYSVFDPHFLNYVIPVCFSISVIIILCFYKFSIKYVQLLCSNIFQIIGITICTRKTIKSDIHIEEYSFFKIFYFLHTFIFLVIIFVQFKKFAFSAFEDKLAMYSNNGLLVYATTFFYPGEIILINLKRILYKKKNRIDYFFIVFSFFPSLLGGGKGGILSFFSSYILIKYFLYMNFDIYGENRQICTLKKQNKYNIPLFLMILPFILIMFVIVNKNRTLPILQLLRRMMQYGDIYYMIYPKNHIEKLQHIPFFTYFFLTPLGPLRKLIGWENPPVLGFEIMTKVYGVLEPKTGPNARFDVVLQLSVPLFLNFVWSFLLGCFYGGVRNSFFMKGKSFLLLYCKLYFIMTIGTMFTDYGLFCNNIFSIIFFLPMIYFLTCLLYLSIKVKIKYQRLIPIVSKFGNKLRDCL